MCVLGGVLLGIWARPALAEPYALNVVPSQPVVGDSVRTVANGVFGMMCWTLTGQTCAIVPGDTLSFTVDVDYCEGLPGCTCVLLVVYYERVCNFGPLPAGTYTVKFTERHSSPYDTEPTTTSLLTFTVTGATPARQPSWGRIRVLYR